jgi:hypothetical protein
VESREFFYTALPLRIGPQIDRAVLIASFEKIFSREIETSVKRVADLFSEAHLARPNTTILSRKLTIDRRVSLRRGVLKALHASDDYLKEEFPELFESKREPQIPSIDHNLLLGAPFIDSGYISDLRNMSELYEALHVLENSIRRLVEFVLNEKIGADWWDRAANAQMKRKHEERLRKEEERKWLPSRSSLGPLYSIDWVDLVTIIRKHEDIFKYYIGEIDFMHRFSDLGSLRNIIAHHGFIEDRTEIQRVALALRDWNQQVGAALKNKNKD